MAAITGNYRPPNKGIGQWTVDWLNNGLTRWKSPRVHLANQLKYIRKAHGRHEAKEFGDYLQWLGVYPVKIHVFGPNGEKMGKREYRPQETEDL